MKKYKPLLIAIAIPVVVGLISGLFTLNSASIYQTLTLPKFAPPAILFPIVWTILYIMMGVASYLIFKTKKIGKGFALKMYMYQLIVNFFWSPIFFGLQNYLFAFIWLALLWTLIILTIIEFYHVNKKAAYIMIPYLLWVTFAGYLNLGIYILN